MLVSPSDRRPQSIARLITFPKHPSIEWSLTYAEGHLQPTTDQHQVKVIHHRQVLFKVKGKLPHLAGVLTTNLFVKFNINVG